jgi:hypothetical protein
MYTVQCTLYNVHAVLKATVHFSRREIKLLIKKWLINSLWIFIFETDKAQINSASSQEKGDWRDICIKQINKIHIKFKIKIKSFKHVAVDDQIKTTHMSL